MTKKSVNLIDKNHLYYYNSKPSGVKCGYSDKSYRRV